MLFARSLSHLSRFTPLVIRRCQSNTARRGSAAPQELKVILDNGTLYIDQSLAETLGWDRVKQSSVSLTLHGWGPTYFAIAQTGSESEQLAERTVESGGDTNVQKVLEYLKDR